MVCRWTPRDTCYHLASRGIFIAGVNERPDGDRSCCATASDGTQTDTSLAIFKRARYSYSFERATALSAGCFRRGPRCCELFGYINWIDKKKGLAGTREKLNRKINHFASFENSISNFCFSKTRNGFEPSKRFEKRFWNYWTYVKHFNGALSLYLGLFFFFSRYIRPIA